MTTVPMTAAAAVVTVRALVIRVAVMAGLRAFRRKSGWYRPSSVRHALMGVIDGTRTRFSRATAGRLVSIGIDHPRTAGAAIDAGGGPALGDGPLAAAFLVDGGADCGTYASP